MLVSPRGHLALADFGMARRVPRGAAAPVEGGTEFFMAPEVVAPGLLADGADARADVWGAGVVLLMLFAHAHVPPHEAAARDPDCDAGRRMAVLDQDPCALPAMREACNYHPQLYDLLTHVRVHRLLRGVAG